MMILNVILYVICNDDDDDDAICNVILYVILYVMILNVIKSFFATETLCQTKSIFKIKILKYAFNFC